MEYVVLDSLTVLITKQLTTEKYQVLLVRENENCTKPGLRVHEVTRGYVKFVLLRENIFFCRPRRSQCIVCGEFWELVSVRENANIHFHTSLVFAN